MSDHYNKHFACAVKQSALQDSTATKADRYRFLADCKRHRIVSALQVLLLRQIHSHDSGAGCWASAATLADEIGSSEATVHRNLRQLHQAGFYRTDQPKKGRGTRAYRVINWTTLEAAQRNGKVSFPAGKGVISAELKVSKVTPEVKELELQVLELQKHTPRARAQDRKPVCVFSESKAEKAESTPKPEPEKPKPQPARQESDTDRRQASGPPDDRHPATVLLQAFVALPWAAHSQNAVKRRWWRLFEAGADLELIYECARLTPAPKLIPPVWLDDERWKESPHFAKVERALAQRQRDAELQAAEDSLTDAQREASEQRRRGLDQQAQEDHQREREESRERSDAGRLAFFASLPRSIARHRSSAAAG